MGTTLTALGAGSITFKWIVAIEGYKWLLTSAAPAVAVAAWDGTDWTQALGGLFVEMDNTATAHPWEPFQGGGTCTLRVVDADRTDTFGIDTNRKLAGGETYLAGTADRNDTTISVRDTSTFASAGEAFIGTECFAYAAKTSTSFTGCTRGRYAPVNATNGARWAEHHRQGVVTNGVSLDPIVSVQPRTWIGRWVTVYLHREVNGVLDSRAAAQLVYAGKIDQVDDDPTGLTVVQLKHVMDTIRDAMIGRDPYVAEIRQGIFMAPGMTLRMKDFSPYPQVATAATANALVVVASGASGANQMNQGYYSLTDICIPINLWLNSELVAHRLWGTYNIFSPVPSPRGLRTKIYWSIPGAANTQVQWFFSIPSVLAVFFGFVNKPLDEVLDNFIPQPNVTIKTFGPGLANIDGRYESDDVPYLAIVTHINYGTGSGTNGDMRMGLTNETGVFLDQFNLLPGATRPKAGSGGLQWGIFNLNDQGLVVAAKNGAELRFILPAWGVDMLGVSGAAMFSGPIVALAVKADQPGPITLKQIVILETTFGDLLTRLFYGSGTSGFNGGIGVADDLGYGLGIGIPGSLLGPNFGNPFVQSVTALPGASANCILVIDKPLKLSDLITSDLILRWAFPRWRQGLISFTAWQVPTNAGAVAVLTENTKAHPAGTRTDDRAATSSSSEWQRDTITIKYNRDTVLTENYLSYLTFEDHVAVDDQGGEGSPLTIKARNTYGAFVNTGLGLEQLAPSFLALVPLFSRPFRKQTLSISPALYEQLGIGDVVTVTDSFARDPATGRRGIFALPALVIRLRSNRGGAQAGAPRGTPAQGEVDVMYGPDQARPAPYSYAATVNSGISGGGFTAGYNSGTLTLRCLTHFDSETFEPRDASRFKNADRIIVIEADPLVSSTPLSWARVISGTPVNDDLVLNAALAAPAFDATKQYRVIYDHFTAQQQSQQILAAQADDATALIENIAPPFQFSQVNSIATFTPYNPARVVEMVPDLCYGDGRPLDVGHQHALVQLANILEDYRTARHCPTLFDVAMLCSTAGHTFELLAYFPIFLSPELLPTTALRVLTVAPQFASATGASVTIRVSLCPSPPVDNTVFDVSFPAGFAQVAFTTTSTTFTIPPAQTLDERVKDLTGLAWVWIEGSLNAVCWGLTQCDQGPRL